MKKRPFRVLNLFAFSLLFLALYLNFIHKDSNAQAKIPGKSTTQGTVLVKQSEQGSTKAEKNL